MQPVPSLMMDKAQGPASGYSLTNMKHQGSLDALIQSEPPAFGVSLPALAGQTFQPLYCTFFSQPFFTHSSVLAWKSHRERTLGGYSPWGHKGQTRLSN